MKDWWYSSVEQYAWSPGVVLWVCLLFVFNVTLFHCLRILCMYTMCNDQIYPSFPTRNASCVSYHGSLPISYIPFCVCFWIDCFLLCLWLMLTWEDLASFWVYSFSICFSLLLACKTHVHEHTHSDLWAWYLFHMPITRQLGCLPAAPPFWAARKPQGSSLIWRQLFITEEASKKKRSLLPIIRQT